ncbi:MAG TPA: tRNA (adenosine(37)-N6)-dimethylallyltransferase MiaA [Gaiellaceae bacterium]
MNPQRGRATVLAIFGPTASGKTAVAEAVAKRVPAELISADSAAVYRQLPILTAAPGRSTRLVGFLDLDEEISVGEYQRLAHDAVDAALAAGRLPVVVGGTGLYFRAALADMAIPPPPAPGERERWERVYDRVGGEAAQALLTAVDPAAAERVHPNDRRRVVRALELAHAGSSLRPAENVLWTEVTRHPTVVVGLAVPPDELDRRIEARAREMFTRGVQDEVRAALGRTPSSTAAKVMGLRAVADLPPGEALAELVRTNRRLARYQRKWMRRIPGIVIIDANRPAGEVADAILEVARPR